MSSVEFFIFYEHGADFRLKSGANKTHVNAILQET